MGEIMKNDAKKQMTVLEPTLSVVYIAQDGLQETR